MNAICSKCNWLIDNRDGFDWDGKKFYHKGECPAKKPINEIV